MTKIQNWLYRNLDAAAWDRPGLSLANKIIFTVVLCSVVTVVFETEETFSRPLATQFRVLNFVYIVFFTIEYGMRLWAMGQNPRYTGFKGRLRYVFSAWSILDLVAIIPFYMSPFLATLGVSASDAFLFRVFRLVRIVSIARIGKFGEALRMLGGSVWDRRNELYVSMALTGFILLVSASVMYVCEKQAQPEAFGSILRALWWGIATLTTVGYGDVYPITVIGKIFAGIIAFAAIGLIAMPTGILAAAFSDAFQKRKAMTD